MTYRCASLGISSPGFSPRSTAPADAKVHPCLELSGPLRFAGGMVRGRAEREARENLERLKRLLEA